MDDKEIHHEAIALRMFRTIDRSITKLEALKLVSTPYHAAVMASVIEDLKDVSGL